MKIILIFTLVLLVASCSEPVDLDAKQTKFESDQSSYELLTKMVSEDFQGERCFSVGTDNIGAYWEFSGEWSHEKNYEKKLKLSEVLSEVGISEKKYRAYLELFNRTQSERVTYCAPSNYYIMAHRSGLGISGCLLNIVKGISPPAGYGKRNNGEDFMEVRFLKNGWWMEYSCT